MTQCIHEIVPLRQSLDLLDSFIGQGLSLILMQSGSVCSAEMQCINIGTVDGSQSALARIHLKIQEFDVFMESLNQKRGQFETTNYSKELLKHIFIKKKNATLVA